MYPKTLDTWWDWGLWLALTAGLSLLLLVVLLIIVAFLVPALLVGKQVLKVDAPMGAHHVEGQSAFLQQPDHEWPGNSQQVGCALSGELLVFRDDQHRFASLHVF